MGWNAFPVTRQLSLDAKPRQKAEVREAAGLKHIEACVAGFARLLFDHIWPPESEKRRQAVQECVNGLRSIQPAIFNAIVVAYQDYESSGKGGKRMISYQDNLEEGRRLAGMRLAAFSDQELARYAQSAVSFLWGIREKNLYARAAVARFLAVDGALLEPRDDPKNGIAQNGTVGSASPLNRNFNQCDKAENRLARSEQSGTYITVSTHLLVKFEGEVMALCTQSFRNSSGQVFIEGMFYAPDKKTEDWLKANYRNTKNYRVDIELPNATWHVLRAYNTNNRSWLSWTRAPRHT